MKNIKKVLLTVLTIALVFSLCFAALIACKDNPSGNNSDKNDPYKKDMDIEENSGTFDDYTLPRGENEKQLIVYWREKGHNYDDNDLWLWEVGGAVGRAFEFHPCSYGAKVVFNVPNTVSSVGFIIRISTVHTDVDPIWNATGKIVDADRFILLTGDVTEVYLTGANQYKFTSTDGGKTLTMIKEITKMSISSLKEITYGIVPSAKFDDVSKIKVTCNGEPVAINSLSSAGKEAVSGVIKLNVDLDLSKNYEVEIEGYGKQTALPMEVFDSADFAAKYNYDGNDLGANITDGNVVFKLWAPTASSVTLNLFDEGNGGSAIQTIPMILGDKGVWSYTAENNVVGKYYTYTVTTAAGKQEAVDPYAKSAGVNGERGMIVDFDNIDHSIGFGNEQFVNTIQTYTEAVIWETHVRDFSNNIASSQYKGKYLAFTETGLTNSHGIPVGVDYVKNLGITHIHLLPVFDYKSVDESSSKAQFNWGYDPQNYNVPEGSYSTDPYHGEVRVKEFKQMVQGLHREGLGVIMDMVYNHTYDTNSNLNKVVPNYYYRYNEDGSNSSGSGCGNDTASERYMYRKYMVDSVSFWVKEYKLDGLRFDLMGLHDVATMQAIEQAVHAINPQAIIYGEGWTMTTAAKKGTVLATQKNINKVTATAGSAGAIAVFNDAIRDGLRGSVFKAEEKGFLLNNQAGITKVLFSIAGAETESSAADWNVKNGAVINYISAHDNNTLWDRLQTPYIGAKAPNKEVLLSANRMGAAIIMLSKGTPFMMAGEEMLRSKVNADGSFNENSYNASDEVNNLKWEGLTLNSDEYKMMLYYKGLIEMRKDSDVLTASSGVTITTGCKSGVITVTFDGGSNGKVIAVINNASSAYNYELPAGNWSLKCTGTQAGAAEIEQASGTVTVEPMSVNVYFSK